jgi:hypothetical protein
VLLAPRLRAVTILSILLGVLFAAPAAFAAAQVNKLSLVLSANPTSLHPKEFNDQVIGTINRNVLDPRGLEHLDDISFAWLFDAQLRYFLRPNFTVEFGAGQLRSIVRREYLPALNAAVQYQAEILSVPVHIGGAYYFAPYNAGDFQARAYAGGGMTSNVYNRERFTSAESNTDTLTTLGGSYSISGKGDSPGYYLETGVHMFFASRYSVMVGMLYRSAVTRTMYGTLQRGGVNYDLGPVVSLDTSGLGLRFGVSIGL